MEGPSISVLMGIYYCRTGTAMLERSVDSLLKQTISDFELIICDDGSTQEVASFLEQIADRDERVKLVRKGHLFSLSSKLNACLQQARGQWIARMDDDDYSLPDRFFKQIAVLQANPNVAFVGSNVTLYRNGKNVGVRILPKWPSVKDFFFVQPYIHPTLIFRREVLLSVNGYSEDKHCILCEDYDLLLRLYAKGYQGMNLQECLLEYNLPLTAKGNRKMRHRWNETVTRYYRFKELDVLPKALPYVLKPLAVGLLPEPILKIVKGISL